MLNPSSTLSSDYLSRVALSLISLVLICAIGVRLSVKPEPIANKLQMFEDRRQNLEAVSIGNSHGRDFHFDSLGLDGMHFYYPSADVEESYRKAMVILERAPSLRYMFVALSPLSLHISQREIVDDYELRRLLVRKEIPWTWNPSSYSLEEYISSFVYGIFPIKHIQNQFFSALGYELEEADIDVSKNNECVAPLSTRERELIEAAWKYEGMMEGFKLGRMVPSCLAMYAERHAEKDSSLVDVTVDTRPEVYREGTDYLMRLADQLAAREARLVVLLPPVTPQFNPVGRYPHLIEQFDQSVAELANHPAIELHDYSGFFEGQVSHDSNPWFFDETHLSITGAVEMSRDLKGQLR